MYIVSCVCSNASRKVRWQILKYVRVRDGPVYSWQRCDNRFGSVVIVVDVAVVAIVAVVVTTVIKFNDIMIARLHNQTHIWCGHAERSTRKYAIHPGTILAVFIYVVRSRWHLQASTRTAPAPAQWRMYLNRKSE